MPNAQKKVILRRFTGEPLPGYLPAGAFVRNEVAGAKLDLLDLSGRVLTFPLNDVKMVSYVRDFNLTDFVNPERLNRRTFLARPRSEGLWMRLTFRSGDLIEGLASADLSFIASTIEDLGLFLTPPDVRSNTQRIFIPRSALSDLQIVAVITTPTRKKALLSEEATTLQKSLFADLPPKLTAELGRFYERPVNG